MRWVVVASIAVVAAIVGLGALRGDDGSPRAPGGRSTTGSDAPSLREAADAFAAGDVASARSMYVELVRRDPSDASLYYSLGSIEQSVGNDEAAVNAYQIALQIDDEHALALFNLGILEADRGRRAEAAALYERAIAADPGFAAAHFNLGLLRQLLGDAEAAVASVRAAICLDGDLRAQIPLGFPEVPTTCG